MKNKVSKKIQLKNETSLRKAYRALGEEISLRTNISINSVELESYIRGVNVVLGIAPSNSWVEFEYKDSDLKTIESYGLKDRYSTDEVEIIFEDHSDTQFKHQNLVIKPKNSLYRITFKLKNIQP